MLAAKSTRPLLCIAYELRQDGGTVFATSESPTAATRGTPTAAISSWSAPPACIHLYKGRRNATTQPAFTTVRSRMALYLPRKPLQEQPAHSE